MPRRSPRPELISRGPIRIGPPECPRGCGFVGEANDRQSPYIACTVGGVADPTRHQRTPVGTGVRA